MSKRKDKIIMWDDLNFLMHRPDTYEKIIEDCMKLIKEHNRLKSVKQIDSIHSFFYHNYLDLMLLMGIMNLCNRIGRLENGKD